LAGIKRPNGMLQVDLYIIIFNLRQEGKKKANRAQWTSPMTCPRIDPCSSILSHGGVCTLTTFAHDILIISYFVQAITHLVCFVIRRVATN
jgi:hypothetical protein